MKDSLHPEWEAQPNKPRPCRPEDDLKALARASERDLPRIEDSMRGLAERQAASPWERLMSELMQRTRTRPWMAPALAAVLAAVMIFVPFSYERTTAYDVKLSLPSAQVDGAAAQQIAAQLRKAVNAQGVRVTANGDKVEVTANVPAGRATGVAGVARAFAAELMARHLDVEAAVSPVRSKVQGNVYAMALSSVVHVNVQTGGKTDAEISADIKSQLAAAGFDVSNIEYRREGGHATLKMTKVCTDKTAPNCQVECPDIDLTVDGKPAGSGGQQVRVKIDKQPGDTDEAIRQRVVDQLRAQGLEANVVVQDGKVVSIDPINR